MNPISKITNREKEVLQLVAQEYSNQEIADELYVSTHTVISHRKNLKKKLFVRNTAGLVRVGFQCGILSL